MVQEVVNSIIEAEDKAKEMVGKAQSEANNIVANAETQADKMLHDALKANKEYQRKELQTAQDKADQQADKQLKADCQAIDESLGDYQGKVDSAVKLVMEYIL